MLTRTMPGSGSSKPLADKAATDDVTTPQVKLPKDAILNKFADIENDQYKQVGEERMRLEVIGQRLLTGRLCTPWVSKMVALQY